MNPPRRTAPAYTPQKPVEEPGAAASRQELEGVMKAMGEFVNLRTQSDVLTRIEDLQKAIGNTLANLSNSNAASLKQMGEIAAALTELNASILLHRTVKIDGTTDVKVTNFEKREAQKQVDMSKIETLLQKLVDCYEKEEKVDQKEREVISSEVTKRTVNGQAQVITQTYSDGTKIEQKITYAKD